MDRYLSRLKALLMQLLAFLAMSFVTMDLAYSWFDCNWTYQSIITITEANGQAITNDKVLITISGADLNANYNWTSYGRDLRIIELDDQTERNFLIESWDAVNETAQIYVSIASLAANASEKLFLYYGNNNATPSPNANTLSLLEPGIRYHTRFTSVDPYNGAQAFSTFDSINDGVPGYGCTVLNTFTNAYNSNFFSPARIFRYGVRITTYYEVRASEVGVWTFRLGGDYGHGGGLYIDDMPISERWREDLWWEFDWNNGEVIQASVFLNEGYHKIEALAFEDCCDGANEFQFRKPGGSFRVMSTANLDLKTYPLQLTDGTYCPASYQVITPLLTVENTETVSLSLKKSSQVIEDPINGLSNPKSIPGARVRYSIEVTNFKGPVDADSVVVSDVLDNDKVKILLPTPSIQGVDGAVASGLTLNYVSSADASDDVAFSVNGTDFSYTATADSDDADASVSHLRFNPKGRMECFKTGNAVPSAFTINFEAILK